MAPTSYAKVPSSTLGKSTASSMICKYSDVHPGWAIDINFLGSEYLIAAVPSIQTTIGGERKSFPEPERPCLGYLVA